MPNSARPIQRRPGQGVRASTTTSATPARLAARPRPPGRGDFSGLEARLDWDGARPRAPRLRASSGWHRALLKLHLQAWTEGVSTVGSLIRGEQHRSELSTPMHPGFISARAIPPPTRSPSIARGGPKNPSEQRGSGVRRSTPEIDRSARRRSSRPNRSALGSPLDSSL